jgi:hypothetical protein
MAAVSARSARNPGCRNRAAQAEILYVIASAEHTGLKILNTRKFYQHVSRYTKIFRTYNNISENTVVFQIHFVMS